MSNWNVSNRFQNTENDPVLENSWAVMWIKSPLSVFFFFKIDEVPTRPGGGKCLSRVHIEDPQTFCRHRPLIIGFQGDISAGAINTHHMCWLRNAHVLTGTPKLWKPHSHTRASLHKVSVRNLLGVFKCTTVNIVTQTESRDAQKHAGDHLLHIIPDEKRLPENISLLFNHTTNVTTQFLTHRKSCHLKSMWSLWAFNEVLTLNVTWWVFPLHSNTYETLTKWQEMFLKQSGYESHFCYAPNPCSGGEKVSVQTQKLHRV